MGVEDAFIEVDRKLRLLPSVVSIELAQPAPHDYVVLVSLSCWDWDSWQQVHDLVDEFARDHVREATLTADVDVKDVFDTISA